MLVTTTAESPTGATSRPDRPASRPTVPPPGSRPLREPPKCWETLTAETSSIADTNGTSNATFAHQWIRSANGSDTDISGATSSSYLLGTDDLDNTIKVRVSFTDDDGYSEILTSDATAAVVQETNVVATGQPTIAGTAEVGETLTAGTSAIADDNGLTNAVFSHQWVRSANGTDTDVTDATGSTYVVTKADIDKAIKVRVSFTDDDGYSETLTSNATTSVPVPVPVIVPPEARQIARAEGATVVPAYWSLIPTGLTTGDQFRLIFLSSAKHDARPSNIDTYNTWIQDLLAAGHVDIQAYSSGFNVVGCTADDDARDNTSTRHDSIDRGVLIHWLNGNKVADEYQDFYDGSGSWNNEGRDKNESGNNSHDTSVTANYPFTGCQDNGTEASQAGSSNALGKSHASIGIPNSGIGGHGPLYASANSPRNTERPFTVFHRSLKSHPTPGSATSR